MKKRVHGRMQLWKASALKVLESLCFRHGLGSVLNRDQEWDDERLLKSPTVLELDALSDVDKAFLTEAMILWLYEFRKNEGKREKFKHALIIEEGHHILSSKKESAEAVETIMESSLRQIREFGDAVIVIEMDISTSFSLTMEERNYLDWLDVGHAIVSMKGRSTFLCLSGSQEFM